MYHSKGAYPKWSSQWPRINAEDGGRVCISGRYLSHLRLMQVSLSNRSARRTVSFPLWMYFRRWRGYKIPGQPRSRGVAPCYQPLSSHMAAQSFDQLLVRLFTQRATGFSLITSARSLTATLCLKNRSPQTRLRLMTIIPLIRHQQRCHHCASRGPLR